MNTIGKVLAFTLHIAPTLFLSAAEAPIGIDIGKGHIIDVPADVRRIALADPNIAEGLVISPREILVNGKLAGETSLYVWSETGRSVYGINVRPSGSKVHAVEKELAFEFGPDAIQVNLQGDAVFLRGIVPNVAAGDRALSIASSLGKVVNLLHVNVPSPDKQVLLRVKFASLDRVALTELGANFFTNGLGNTVSGITNQQFNPPQLSGGVKPAFSVSDALNIFLFRSDLNLGATIRALQERRLLEVLAEPNVLAANGKTASFLSGGEFPYPVVQGGGSGVNTVTIMFREFGIRLQFVPTLTPQGTIKLQVAPEVSALDYANGLSYSGFHVPAISIRRVQTEIELQNGQSFAIAGLLDNRTIQTLSKVPGLGDIPLFGKLFHSKSVQHDNSELLVMVTPEMVDPIPAGQPVPEIAMPEPFMPNTGKIVPGHSPARAPGATAQLTIPIETARPEKKGSVPQASEVK